MYVFYANLPYNEQFNILLNFFTSTNTNIHEIYDKINSEIFYDIPFHYNYRINSNGVVYNCKENKIVDLYINKTGYVSLTIERDYSSRSVTANLHRLLAIVFIKNDTGLPIEDLHVNHINGIKTDFRLTNLEWVTKQQNCIHAYSNGLRSDNKHIICENIDTGKVLSFYSIGQTAKFFNCNTSSIHFAINKFVDGSIFRGYKIKYKNI